MPPRKRTPAGQSWSRPLTLLPKLLQPHGDAPDLRDAVAEQLSAMALTDVDQPLAALARRYAKEIEHAVELTADAERLLEAAAEDGDVYASLEIKRLRRRIEQAEIVAKIGPLLHRALADLAPTPAARSKGGAAQPTSAGRLGQLRGELGAG